MKVKLDDEVLYEIDERMFKMMEDYIVDPLPDIKRRLQWVIEHLCDQIHQKLVDEWVKPDQTGQSKLAQLGVESIPTSKTGIIDVILNHPKYMNRVKKEEYLKKIEDEREELKRKQNEENAKKIQEEKEKVVPIESEK